MLKMKKISALNMATIFNGKRKKFSTLIALLMVAVCIFSLATPVAAATWRKGCFPSNGRNTSAITVTLSNKSKDAYIRIHTYTPKNRVEAIKSNPATKERSCSIHVTMRDKNGKWIWEGNVSSGSSGIKMKLGHDHSVYKLYINHPQTVHCWDVGHYCPIYWGIESVTNCSIN